MRGSPCPRTCAPHEQRDGGEIDKSKLALLETADESDLFRTLLHDSLRHFPYIVENDFFYDFRRYEMRKTIRLSVSYVMTAIEVV